MGTGAELRLAAYRRPIFRPRSGHIYVCVRSVRLASNDIRPAGTEFQLGDLSSHHLRSLYNRRLIGIKDTVWTELMLDHWETLGNEVIVEETPESAVEIEVEESGDDPEDALEEDGSEEEPSEEEDEGEKE